MTISDLKSCVSYKIRVSALCGSAGVGAFSDEITVATSSENHVAKHLTTPENLLKYGDASQGEPSIYRLPLSAGSSESEDKYRIYHFGEPENEGGQHRVIMLVGATGAGKSTLINAMVNYILGVDWEDAFRFKIIAAEGENESGYQAESQTQYITSYTIHHSKCLRLRHTLTIIDTPGFGNTKGVDEDHAILEQIRDFFSESTKHHIDYINAIGFVAQASQTRLTQFQRYVFELVQSLFEKNVEDNLQFLLTFADSQKPPFVDVIKAANIPSSGNIFKFNNATLFSNTIDLREESATQRKSESDKQEETFEKLFWRMGIQSMGKLFSVLDKRKPKSLSPTPEVLLDRKLLQVLQPKIEDGCDQLATLRQETNILKEHLVKERRKYSELERKYNTAVGKKLTDEEVLQMLLEEFNDVQQCVFRLISQSHRCIQRLEGMALKPNPITVVDYVDLLIQSERREGKSGWKERVQSLEDIRKEVDILQKIQQSDYNPFEIYLRIHSMEKIWKK